MAIQGCDYAFSRPSPSGLFAAGLRFAMRYVGPGTDDKHLHLDERDALWAAGLGIVLLAEGTANGALYGFSAGQSHASSALSNARALGAPDSLPIYFAVDFDVTPGQWPTVVEYLGGAASVIGASRVGIYGGVRAMQWAARDRVASWFFQTFAWSYGQWYPGNHVEQYDNDVSLAGGTVDLCRAVQANYGQWGGDDMPTSEEVAAAVWAYQINAISLDYNQPAAEFLKWTRSNANDIARLTALVQSLPETLAADLAGKLAADPAFIAAVAGAVSSPSHTHPLAGNTGEPVSP